MCVSSWRLVVSVFRIVRISVDFVFGFYLRNPICIFDIWQKFFYRLYSSLMSCRHLIFRFNFTEAKI